MDFKQLVSFDFHKKKHHLHEIKKCNNFAKLLRKKMINNAQKLWNNCLDLIKRQIGEDKYQSWFTSLTFNSYNQETNVLCLNVQNIYIKDYIEEHYLELLRKVLTNHFGKGIRLMYHTKASIDTIQEDKKAKKVAEDKTTFTSYLDKTRTFDNFIAGRCNRMPRAIGMSIAENTSKTQFNPFFIFGPSGCGKTHLINAIGMKMHEMDSNLRILYVSARIFQVQYTDAVLHNTTNDFIHFYQTIDVLIIDDIQEWLSAVKTQEIFFHIFNHLFLNGKRIILASDRPPVDLKGMTDRLLTRLKCGLVAELEKPDVQLCKDILTSKSQTSKLKISEEVIDFVANTANGSVRDIEGILNSLIAMSLVYKEDITLSTVKNLVKTYVRTEKKETTIDDILNTVCNHYKVSIDEISGKSRKQELVQARQVSMFLADRYTSLSKSQIGRRIANRDHTTVLHSCDKIRTLIKENKVFAAEIEQMETILN